MSTNTAGFAGKEERKKWERQGGRMDAGRYDDMLDLPRHVSKAHPPMKLEERAAQFAPFAALTGHRELVKEVEDKEVTGELEIIEEWDEWGEGYDEEVNTGDL